ncbi:helix-turn-helix domain-containing protein [Micromonospora sp. NPDC126480]|uniref:AraC-like ligand-binding domain-containing protein n=1 Tax=Micromonospora sp. NPDC126480 TaxID=3155312 RepID=UPI0033256F44
MTDILTTASVSTIQLPPAERFDFWLDLVARESVPARIASTHAADFAASARVVDLGVVKLAAWTYPSLELHRTSSMIGSTDPELYQLALPLSGSGAMRQGRQEAALRPDGFALVDTIRPHASTHRPGHPAAGPLRTVTALVPHAALPLPAVRVRDLLAAHLPADRGMGLLLAQFLRQVVEHPEQYATDDAKRLDIVALDLIAGTLAARLGTDSVLPAEVRDGGLRARVEAFVTRHLADPTLRPESIAAAHHVSVRTLHRLFEGTGTTVAALVRSQRLERCLRDLTDPRLCRLTVQEIGRRWAFHDPAHFNRAFRLAYGLSPGEHRERARTPD